MSEITFTEVCEIGRNTQYTFSVGKVGNRWVGFAKGGVPVDGKILLFVFAEVSDGFQLGITDQPKAIRMTGALAQDPERAYGGITSWYVPKDLRGKLKDFRCKHCGTICCEGDCYSDF